MGQAKHKTAFLGVRYREHATRKIKGTNRPDRGYYIRYKVGGRDREESVGWYEADEMTPDKAAAILSIIRNNIRNGTGPQSYAELKAVNKDEENRKKEFQEREAIQKVTFGQLYEDIYLPNAKIQKNENTINIEKAYYKKWIEPILKDILLKDVDYSHIDRILQNMNDIGRADRTKNYVLTIIIQAWKYAKDYKYIDVKCPAQSRIIKKIDNERTRALSIEEANLLLEELKKHSSDLHDMAILAMFCGLRAGEIFNLKWSDVNINEHRIQLLNTKSSRTQYAWFGPEVEEVFKERMKNMQSKSDLIFPGEKGKKHKTISVTFKRCVDRLGLNDGATNNKERIVFHSLRHTYATWLLEQEANPYYIMKLMRHANFNTMQKYIHAKEKNLKDNAELLNGILEKNNNKEMCNVDNDTEVTASK